MTVNFVQFLVFSDLTYRLNNTGRLPVVSYCLIGRRKNSEVASMSVKLTAIPVDVNVLEFGWCTFLRLFVTVDQF